MPRSPLASGRVPCFVMVTEGYGLLAPECFSLGRTRERHSLPQFVWGRNMQKIDPAEVTKKWCRIVACRNFRHVSEVVFALLYEYFTSLFFVSFVVTSAFEVSRIAGILYRCIYFFLSQYIPDLFPVYFSCEYAGN